MAMKTLLVGLGGTGCEIVARVKRMIHDADADVQYVGFDTDNGWAGTDGLPMVYTSRDQTVRDYLRDIPKWREWFPDNPALMEHTMIKGAGQIRVLSRLAFMETVSSNRIGPLAEAIRKLKVARGEISPTSFRVMVISSFAGGTGSGMFIQAALFIRQFIRQNYGGEVVIRGLFALPDLFMGKVLSPVQRESMYANAYAALRELNAINMATLAKDPAGDQVHMAIDQIFDSKRDRLKGTKKPFDFIFLVDNVNAEGKVMRSMEEYKELLTTAAYMQVYSPVTDAGDSREDNAIMTVIGQDGKPLYGSVGASRIVYPYRDIVDYCALRATVDSVSELWTLIDKQYRQADAENKRMMALDPTVKVLDRGEHFLATLQLQLESGNTKLNFLQRALSVTNEDGKATDRVETFYDAVYGFVTDKLKNDEQVRATRDDAGITEKHFKRKDSIVTNVTKNETALKDYLDTVNNRILLLRGSLGQAIFPNDLNSVLDADADWNILSLLRMGGCVTHPLAQRALLYKLRGMLQNQYENSKGETASLAKRINNYFSKGYDLEATPQVETASSRAADSKRGGTKFRNEYLQKSDQQKSRITRYCEHKIVSMVFEDVLKRVNALIRQLERLFDNLESICKLMQKEAEVLESKKHSDSGSSDTFVCASAEWKQEIYASLDYDCSDSNENNVYDAILYTLYDEAMKELKYLEKKHVLRAQRLSAKEQEQQQAATMNKLFREHILARNTADLERSCGDVLNLNVFEAMEREAEYLEDAKQTLLKSAFHKSETYLKTTQMHQISLVERMDQGREGDEGCAYALMFWGVHPEVAETIQQMENPPSLEEYFKAGNENFTPEVVVNEEYSRYEISCYQALYCVALTEVPKFQETGDHFGAFYQNYASRISKMTVGGKYITPHLDIYWHSRRYLPMISDSKNEEDDRNTARAMWLALIYNGLPDYESVEGKGVCASFARIVGRDMRIEEKYTSCELLYQGKPAKIENPYGIFKALQFDELIRDRFLEVFSQSFQEDKVRGMSRMEFTGPRARTLAKALISESCKARNALNLLGKFAANTDARPEEVALLHRALLDLLDEFTEGLASAKQRELRALIYNASYYAKSKTKRDQLARYVSFDYWKAE